MTELTSPSGLRAALDDSGTLLSLMPSATSSSTYSSAVLSRAARRISCCVATQRASRAPRCSDRAARRAGIATLRPDRLEGAGVWQGLRYRCMLRLAAAQAPAWFWHVRVENVGAEPVRVDLLLLQDLALAPYGALRMNEYYVSQYLDHAPLEHAARGTVLASRQNQAVGGRDTRGASIGSLNRAVALCDRRAAGAWPRRSRRRAATRAAPTACRRLRLQHEHAMAALQDACCDLAPGGRPRPRMVRPRAGRPPAGHVDRDLDAVDRDARAARSAAAGVADRIDRPGQPVPNLFTTARRCCGPRPRDCRTLMRVRRRATPCRARRRRPPARLLPRPRPPRRPARERARGAAPARPPAAHGPAARPRRKRAHLDRVDGRRVPFDADAGPRQHQPLPVDGAQLPRPVPRAGPARLRRGRRRLAPARPAFGVRDVARRLPLDLSPCRRPHRGAQRGAQRAARASASTSRSSTGTPMRCLVCLHVALDGDDGSAPGRVNAWRDGRAVVFAPAAEERSRQALPEGPLAHRAVERRHRDRAARWRRAAVRRRRDARAAVPGAATAAARAARFTIVGRFVEHGPDVPAPDRPDLVTGRLAPRLTVTQRDDNAAAPGLRRLVELLPWLRQNALSTTSPRAGSSSSRAAAGARATSARARSSCCSRTATAHRCATCCCA